MPTYEYKCISDGSKFELWQEVGSEAPPCPDCGAPSKKVFGPPRVHFKGSGFYLTDLRAEQSAGKNGEKTEATNGSEADSAVKTDAKAETKSETSTATETKTESKTEAKPATAPASTPAPGAPGK